MHLKTIVTLWNRLSNFLHPYSGKNTECAYSALYEECTFMLCGKGKGKLNISSQPATTFKAKSEFAET
jgi:hypothetical protein